MFRPQCCPKPSEKPPRTPDLRLWGSFPESLNPRSLLKIPQGVLKKKIEGSFVKGFAGILKEGPEFRRAGAGVPCLLGALPDPVLAWYSTSPDCTTYLSPKPPVGCRVQSLGLWSPKLRI